MLPRWTIDRSIRSQVRTYPLTRFENLDFVRNLLFSLLKNSKSVVDERGHRFVSSTRRALSSVYCYQGERRTRRRGVRQRAISALDTLSKKRRSRELGGQQEDFHSNGIEVDSIWIVGRRVFLTTSCCLRSLLSELWFVYCCCCCSFWPHLAGRHLAAIGRADDCFSRFQLLLVTNILQNRVQFNPRSLKKLICS